jgi:hypothetical protein
MDWNQRKQEVLQMADNSLMPHSLLVMSMLSDVQEMMARGMTKAANDTLNNAKIIIDARLATKDEHGRHMNQKMTITNDPSKPFGLTPTRLVCKNSLTGE